MTRLKKITLIVLLTFGIQLSVARSVAQELPPPPPTQLVTTQTCVEARRVSSPCVGLLVNEDEALELLKFKNVTHLQILGEIQTERDELMADLVELQEDFETLRKVANIRAEVGTGHSTWTVVAWTALGLALGIGAGYIWAHER
jgi:hypothetical protein